MWHLSKTLEEVAKWSIVLLRGMLFQGQGLVKTKPLGAPLPGFLSNSSVVSVGATMTADFTKRSSQTNRACELKEEWTEKRPVRLSNETRGNQWTVLAEGSKTGSLLDRSSSCGHQDAEAKAQGSEHRAPSIDWATYALGQGSRSEGEREFAFWQGEHRVSVGNHTETGRGQCGPQLGIKGMFT